jgi:catechol 2,3-dioxygenase-like lactoylglutathione lyase family enzyme
MISNDDLPLSHLIVRVVDTDATIAFWVKGLGAVLESDEELAAPALDAIYGRKGVRIRDTFIRYCGIRLHTIETLDRKRKPAADSAGPQNSIGIGGLSFRVSDIEKSRAETVERGLTPTPIYDFDQLEEPVRMYFLDDPDGIRLEMIAALPA